MSAPTSSGPPRNGPPEAISFRDRLLAEAVRVYEGIHGDLPEPEDDPSRRPDTSTEPSIEAHIVRRAARLSIAPDLRSALDRLRQILGGFSLLGAGLAALAGAATTHAALGFGRSELINVFVVLSALLAAQTVVLVFWLLLVPLSPASGALGSLGGGVIGLARRWFRRFQPGEAPAAAAAASGEVMLRSPIGKWSIGTISNGLWLSFNVGALAALVFLLSTRHYLFVWETTILSHETFARLTEWAASLPAALGFDTPDAAAVRDSLWTEGVEPSPATRQAWSGFVIGCTLVYGLAPRLLLFLSCLALRAGALRSYRLDLDGQGFARLRSRLRPPASRLGVVDPDEGEASEHVPPARPERTARPMGDPAVLAVEIAAPASGWPPTLEGVRWWDLGFVDDGGRRRVVRDELASGPTEPSHVVCVCALSTTPDRGIRAFLEELERSVASDLVLVLTGGHVLRKRTDADGVRLRIDDWRTLATAAGIPPELVLELDLDHLTSDSARALRGALGLDDGKPGTTRRIERAFDRIAERSAKWREEPSLHAQAELQRELARLYEKEGEAGHGLREMLGIPRELPDGDLAGALGGHLDSTARRALDLLPARLRQSPRWIAAGAVTGALACVATGLLAAPVALATLPTWSVVGGAIGGLLKTLRKEKGAPETPDSSDSGAAVGAAVRAAVLYALLLELQGSGEERITRVLDRSLDDEDAVLTSPERIRRWLDKVRHRLDLALASETTG